MTGTKIVLSDLNDLATEIRTEHDAVRTSFHEVERQHGL